MTLIGDAAHPMTPFRAQGANQALSDATLLAECLAKNVAQLGPEQGFEAALPEFERKMLPRSARAVVSSREKAKELHSKLVLQKGRKTQRGRAEEYLKNESAIRALRAKNIGAWSAMREGGLDKAVAAAIDATTSRNETKNVSEERERSEKRGGKSNSPSAILGGGRGPGGEEDSNDASLATGGDPPPKKRKKNPKSSEKTKSPISSSPGETSDDQRRRIGGSTPEVEGRSIVEKTSPEESFARTPPEQAVPKTDDASPGRRRRKPSQKPPEEAVPKELQVADASLATAVEEGWSRPAKKRKKTTKNSEKTKCCSLNRRVVGDEPSDDRLSGGPAPEGIVDEKIKEKTEPPEEAFPKIGARLWGFAGQKWRKCVLLVKKASGKHKVEWKNQNPEHPYPDLLDSHCVRPRPRKSSGA